MPKDGIYTARMHKPESPLLAVQASTLLAVAASSMSYYSDPKQGLATPSALFTDLQASQSAALLFLFYCRQ